MRQHRSPWPTVLAMAGAGLVLYALFIDYRLFFELSGFVFLAAAIGSDTVLRRRYQESVLGLDS